MQRTRTRWVAAIIRELRIELPGGTLRANAVNMNFNVRHGLQGLGILAAAIASVATSSPAEILASKSKSDDQHTVALTTAAPVRTFKVRVHAERGTANGTFKLNLHAATRGVIISGDAFLANQVCVGYKNPASFPTQTPSFACITRGQEHPNVAISVRNLPAATFGQINGVEFGADAATDGLFTAYYPGVCYTYNPSGQLVSGNCDESYRVQGSSCRGKLSCDLDVEVKLALIDPALGADTVPLTLAALTESEGTDADLKEIVISDLP